MKTMIQFLLPAYFLIYFGFVFIGASLLVARRIGKSPLVFTNDDSAHALTGRYFKLIIFGLFIYMIGLAIFGADAHWQMHIHVFENKYIVFAGIFLLSFSLIWTIAAQRNMHNSWRIGIDHNMKTKLITWGLFRFSRNPTFVGMLSALLGFFMITPNVFTMLFFIIGYILIQIQVRLEEEHLLKVHGDEYVAYKNRVRRFL